MFVLVDQRDNGEQFYAKACCEYTFPRSDGSSQPQGWIQGSTKIEPVLEVTTSCLYHKHGVEIRFCSLSEDKTQSCVRNSHRSSKFVIESYNNDRSSWRSAWRTSVTTEGEGFCKGNVSCTSYSRTFTIHKWLRQIVYIFTRNLNMLEHIANNGMNTRTHTDANIAQFWARRAPSVDAHVFIHRICGSRSRFVCHSISSMHAHLCLVSWAVSPHPSLYFFFQFFFQLYLMSIPALDEISMEDPLCDSSLESIVTLDYVTPSQVMSPRKWSSQTPMSCTSRPPAISTSRTPWTIPLPSPTSLTSTTMSLQNFLAVVVDRTGQPVEVRSNNDQFSCDIRNLKSAQSQVLLVTQRKRMISQTGGSVQERIAEERESSNAQIRTMLDEQRRTIIAEYCETVSHRELFAARAEHERRIHRENSQGEVLRQQQDFREVPQQELMKQKELQKFPNSTFDESAQKKFIEDQKIIMELSGRLQELQNEVNCMNDSKDFQDAESVRSGNSHVTSQPGVFPKHPASERLLRRSFISKRQTEEPPNIWDISGLSGNVFAHPQASSSAPYPQEVNSTWRKTIEEPIHMSTAEKSERPERDPDLRCQSGPSAKDSVVFSGGDSSKNYGADHQRLQISDLHFDKFPTPATFACWKIRFKTEVCTCSLFLTEAMQWNKEVELVDSVDELRSSSSTCVFSMPNFEVLDARIASALNKIIHNSHFKKENQCGGTKGPERGPFFFFSR